MSWQDIVLTSAQVIFAIALLPSIFSKDKPAMTTSIMNGTVLLVISYVNTTLSLWGAATGLFVVSVLWGVLAVQKYRINKKNG